MDGAPNTASRHASALRIRLLGGVDIRHDDRPLPALDSARAESLLAYLLLHRDAAHPRERIAFLLWPDSAEPQARTNLRHVLHTLRRRLPDPDRYLDATQRTLRWREDAPYWLDVAEFERAVAEGRLGDAVAVYSGDLLEGSYDDWLLEERGRLSQMHLDVLARHVRDLEAVRRWPEAIANAEGLLRRDPLREETYRMLMRLCDASGDRARAMRVYHVCDATLRRELGVEPSAATRRIYDLLLPDVPDPAPSGVPAAPILVGRASERARLTACWRSAESVGANLVVVSGEAGIGKTRIVEQLRSWCLHAGAAVVEAHAYAAEGSMTYGALADWLRAEPVAARLGRLDPADVVELARLMPELLTGDSPAPEPLPEAEQRRRLFSAAMRAITSVGASVLLIADDLQWFDEASLQFVHYLLRACSDARVMIAATLRREDLDEAHPARDLIAGVQALGRYTEIPLERLGHDETRLLADHVAGRALSDVEARLLYDESEGNPLFVVEAIRSGTEESPGAGMVVSPKVQAVITSRLARLSEAAAELIGAAAIIGRAFTTDLLAEAAGFDEHTFVGALDELWRRGLVRAQGPRSYDFSHDKIREAVGGSLAPARARRQHLLVASALEAEHARGDESLAGRIASHYDAAGAHKEAIEWHEAAARASQRLHADGDAVHALERALELAAGLAAGPARDALELRLLTALTAPLIAVDGYLSGRTTQIQHRALALAEALGVEPEPPLVRSLSLASVTRGDIDAARSFGAMLRARAERDGDGVLLVESAYVLGIASYWQGRLADALSHLQGAVAAYRPARRSEHLLRYGQDPDVVCRMREAHVLWLLGRDDAARMLDAAVHVTQRSGHPYSVDSASFFAAIIALDRHDDERLREHCARFLSGQSVAAARQHRASAEAFAGFVDVLDGNVDEGIRRVRDAFARSRGGEAAAPGQTAFLARLLVEACARAARPDLTADAAGEALAASGSIRLWEAEIRRLRAGALRASGADRTQVEAELRGALDVSRIQEARSFETRILADLERSAAGTL